MENTTQSYETVPGAAPELGEVFELFNFHKAKVRIDRLISNFNSRVVCEASKHRDARYVKLDVNAMRKSGEIEEDSTYIPERIIDSNIIREKSDAMLFLNSSHRLAYFRCVDDPTVDTRSLESDFTKGLTYNDWYRHFDRNFDGAALHGWAAIEVLHDPDKPAGVAFEYVAYDKLIFNLEVEDIQESELLLRKYRVSSIKLESFVTKNGFDKIQVDKLLQKSRQEKRDDEVFTIYKKYCKYNGIVYISWYSPEGEVTDWLKKPELLKCGILQEVVMQPLSIGAAIANSASASDSPSNIIPAPTSLQDKPVDVYPIFKYLYRDDEQEAIVDHKGRGFLDLPLQEAMTAMKTALVNGTTRASNVYGSPKEDTGDSADIKQLDVPLENGTIFSRPMIFFNLPYPDPILLNALQALDQSNSKDTGKIATAVSNRKDSRKTAKELSVAQQEEVKLTSTNLATYSEFLRQVFSFAWHIVQSQGLANNIKIALKQQVDPLTGQISHVNDIELLGKEFDIRAAGDVDVIQKQKQVQDMQQDWPVLGPTPLGPKLMEDYIRLRYPHKADEYIAILKAGDPAKQIVGALLEVTKGALTKEEVAVLNPEQQQQLQTVLQTAEQFIAQPQMPNGGTQNASPTNP